MKEDMSKRVGEIEARMKNPTYSWAHEMRQDITYLLAELRKAHEALARVETLAERAESNGNLYVFVDDLTSAVAAANGDGRNHVSGTEWGTDHWGEVLSEPTEDHARSVARAAGANVYHRSPTGQWIKDESE